MKSTARRPARDELVPFSYRHARGCWNCVHCVAHLWEEGAEYYCNVDGVSQPVPTDEERQAMRMHERRSFLHRQMEWQRGRWVEAYGVCNEWRLGDPAELEEL